MSQDELTLADLARGLNHVRGLFGRLDVFVDDVAELIAVQSGKPSAQLRPLDAKGEKYLFEHESEKFVVEISVDGVARVRRADNGETAFAGALFGSAVGAAIGAAQTKKGAGWAKGLLLGMLVGTAVGASATPSRPKRVLTMRFDPISRTWAAYDGGLVTWIKSEFEPTG